MIYDFPDEMYFRCEEGHEFRQVMDCGVISHYNCKYCHINISEEVYDALMNLDKERDVVDDDDMC